ncbi:MAG: DHA2 family efflux MFS transporter permease subunit, partial [Anaerolineae bacterium]|nr:DHA2 family efflux MFS transporter permease subunit [Anaerolineae bacterium]
MLSVAMGVFLSTIDSSIVQVALPTLEEELHTDFATVQWVIISYLLVLCSMMLGVARLADMIGKKRIYLSGMVVFTVGSVLCGTAPTVGALIAFRVIQGAGAVMIQALGSAIVTENFPPTERGRALGITGLVVSMGIILGPTLGGLLIGVVGWRAIFLVNLPVGIAGFLLSRRYIPGWRPAGSQRFDAVGAVIMALTLVALAVGLTFGPTTGWNNPTILGLLFGAAVGVVIFLGVQARLVQPMIDLRLFRDLLFSISLATGLLVFVAMSARIVLPFYLEEVKGYQPQHVGLFLTIIPIALGVMAPISGSLSDRYGSRGISLLGLVVIVGGCWLVSTLKEDTGTLGYILRLVPFGIGFGLFQSPNNSAIMGAAPREHLGVASGLLALSRNLGQVIGIPLLGAVYSSRVIAASGLGDALDDVADAPPFALVEGLQAVYLTAAGLIVVGVLLAGIAFR